MTTPPVIMLVYDEVTSGITSRRHMAHGCQRLFYMMLHSPIAGALISIVMSGLVVSISLAGIRNDSIIGA